MCDMWNTSFREHLSEKPNCRGNLLWDDSKEEQRGFVWRAILFCDKCNYISKKFNLYTTLQSKKRGPKTAAINHGMQVGLSQVPIGGAGLRKILLSGNIPAPSTKGMQLSANIVNEQLISANQKDMANIRNELKLINDMRGHAQNQIDIESDGCYNNPLYSGVGKTPFQPATQSCYVVVENMTDKKLVINLVTKNKLCSYGKDHSEDDLNIKECKCTQNLQMTESIGNEEKSAKDGFQTLYNEGIEIRHLTTDPDSSSFRAAEVVAREFNAETSPKSLLDTRHFSDNQRKFIRNNNNMLNLMPGGTVKERSGLLNQFALDLSQRCTAEYESALTKCNGDTAKFKNKLSHTVDAMILCYQNKHCICRTKSFVCAGRDNPWVNNSKYLPKNFKLNLTLKEQTELRKCINYRLAPQELERTKLGTNTQKSECVNKVIRRSLPRSINFSKNFPGRANSAVSAANHGPADSVKALCLSVGSPITCSKVENQLKGEQKIYENNKRYKKTNKYKQSRREKIRKKFELYAKHQETVKYKKGMLLKRNREVSAKKDVVASDHDMYTKKVK